MFVVGISFTSVAHADTQAEARAAFNRNVRGDESGQKIAAGSPLALASQACGTELDATVDFAKVPAAWSDSTTNCGAVVDAFTQLCTDHNYGPAVKKIVKKIECRYDGKHDPGPSADAITAALTKDMELKNGVFVYHMRQSHANITDGVGATLDRDLQAFKELRTAGIMPYQLKARKADNLSLYGDEDGQTIKDGSLLGNVKRRCGITLAVTVDYLSMTAPEDPLTPDTCGAVVEAIGTLCKAAEYKSIFSKLKKVDCRRDGKHVGGNNNISVDANDKQVSLDMDIQGSTFIYHANPTHGNINDAMRLVLARKK